MKKRIRIGIGDPVESARDFIRVWKQAEREETVDSEIHLRFEDMETLPRTLTPRRWILLNELRPKGPMSVRALAGELRVEYKNVEEDSRSLEHAGLIERMGNGEIIVPLDIVEASLHLAA